jgi:transposase
LQSEGVTVIEVNRPHQQLRRRRGKSDPIDAEGAARMVLAGEATALGKDHSGIVEAIRVLRVARSGAVKSRTAALNQLKDLITTAPETVRAPLRGLRLLQKAKACAQLRADMSRLHDPTQATLAALRALADRITALTEEITRATKQLRALVAQAAPRTMGLHGVSAEHAGQLLATAGDNPHRLRSEAAFAALCAAAPIPASSGKTDRHRLNPAGDRNANQALHMIAVVRMRWCPATRAYVDRRTAEGLSKKDIMRCLKRYIAREVYRAIQADLANLRDRPQTQTDP